MTDEQKQAVRAATGSPVRKVFYWGLAVLGILLTVALFLWLFRKKPDRPRTPIEASRTIVDAARQKIAEIDAQAKAKVAEAAGAEKQVVVKVREVAKLPEKERNAALAKLLAEDY